MLSGVNKWVPIAALGPLVNAFLPLFSFSQPALTPPFFTPSPSPKVKNVSEKRQPVRKAKNVRKSKLSGDRAQGGRDGRGRQRQGGRAVPGLGTPVYVHPLYTPGYTPAPPAHHCRLHGNMPGHCRKEAVPPRAS